MTKWVTKKLGEIGDFYVGGDVDKSCFSAYPTMECKYPIYANALVNEGLYGYSSKYEFDKEAVTITGRGDVGKVFYRKPYFSTIIRLVTLVPKNPDIDVKFLSYAMSKINFIIESTGVPQLTAPQAKKYEIYIPESLTEQKRIASILSSADGAIAASEALIEKYRNIKRGLLATLLQPKEGWKKVKLGECCETELGKTLDSGRNIGIYRPYLCALNVLWGKIDLSTIKQMRIEESEKERYLVKRGDLLVCEGGEIGRCAIWNSDEEIYYQNALHRVRFKEEYDAMFFMYLLGYYNDLNLIEQYGKGLTIKHLNQTSFRAIPVFIPDLTEQRRIAEILSSVDAKIAAEEKVVEKYKGVKKGLMEELMKRDCEM